MKVATEQCSYTLNGNTLILEDGFKVYDIFIPYKDILYIAAIGIIGVDIGHYQPVYGEKQIYMPINGTFKFKPML